MKQINRDGFKLNYTENIKKDKPAIMVIGSATYYPRLFKDEIFNNLNLIFIDHRGFSKPYDHNIYDLDLVVSDIEAIREDLELDEFYILGHSGHGFMAMRYAERYPEHILGLILSNLAPNNTKKRQELSIQYFKNTASKDRKTYFYQEISKLDSDIQKDPDNRFSHMNIRMQAHSFYDYTYDGAYLWDDIYNNMDALDYLWGEAFAVFDTESFFKSFKKPILLLLSDYDYLVAPTSLWDDIISGIDVEVHKFDKSGHNPMLEEPEKYHEILRQFTKTSK